MYLRRKENHLFGPQECSFFELGKESLALWPDHGTQWEKEQLRDALMGFVSCGRDVTGIGVAMASELLMFIGNE